MDTIKVGDVEIIAVSDGYGDMDPLTVFTDASVGDWSHYPELTDDEGHIHPRFGTTVIKVRGKTIIVDTGLQGADATLLEQLEEILKFLFEIKRYYLIKLLKFKMNF